MIRTVSDVSVVICTHDLRRWDALAAAVESVRSQSVHPREIIVVVDHNPALLARAIERFVDAVVIPNDLPAGLSGARNSGVGMARGKLIAFLDDDAVADPEWLKWLTAFEDDPRVMGAGGWVDPIWEVPPPAWLPSEFLWVVGCSYRGLPETSGPVRNLLGGNMCIRREVFSEVGGFRSGIGRDASRPMGCEETELCIRARQRWPDKMFVQELRARIQHRVPKARLNWGYFAARCHAEGQSKALISRHVGAGDGLASERRYILTTLPRGVLRGLSDAAWRRDATGLGRAGAIVAGLAMTAMGYFHKSFTMKLAATEDFGPPVTIGFAPVDETVAN